MAQTFAAAYQVLDRAIADKAFPAAVVEVGTAHQPLWRHAFGQLSFESAAPATREDTIFDLASLTKSLATPRSLCERSNEAGWVSTIRRDAHVALA